VREGLAPVTLGSVARISMILDPDGNWIELSRRVSLSETSSGWRKTENRGMLLCHEGSLQAYWLDGRRSDPLASSV
jgi:hypothetical protein